jgi:quinol monooxygenase YgiN
MQNVIIEAFNFQDLEEDAKKEVIYWLDYSPQEYEKEDGSFGYSYYADLDKEDEYLIVEMCEMNNYLFNQYGEPIHHLIKKGQI